MTDTESTDATGAGTTETSAPDATLDSVEPTPTTSKPLTAGPAVAGDALPVASERHQEGEPTVGLVAPSLVSGDLLVPSAKPTLILVVVGSCADCEAAALALTPLAVEFDAVAVVIGPQDSAEMPEPWVLVASEDLARAYGGRDRPTALVIGTDGTVLSRIRPFNRTGTSYDGEDIKFGLQIASNQALGAEVAGPVDAIVDGRVGALPDSFFAIEAGGDALEVSTSTGEILNRIPGPPTEVEPEIQSQVFDELISIPGSQQLLLNECCEPAAGFIGLLDGWAGYDPAKIQTRGFNTWEVSPAPDGRHLAFSGYTRSVYELGTEPLGLPANLGASNGSNPDVAWLRDRLGVVYLHRGNSPAVVEIIEFDSEYRPISRRSFSLDGTRASNNQWTASSIDVNADGMLVVVANPSAAQTAKGQVYDPDSAKLVAEFGLETGVFEIDYDVTGRFLAYVDRDGIARWQGGGESGLLGENYRSVTW